MFVFKRVRASLHATMPVGAFIFIVAVGFGGTLGLLVNSHTANAKTPGSTYCFYGKCHRVKTLSEMQALVGREVSLHASHYDSCHRDRYNPCGLTSSGEPFFSERADNAASPIYPDGTKLLVWAPQSKQAAVLRVNNAGPYWGNRKLDVSRALARKLGFEHRGVAKLQVRVLSAPTKAEARYKRNRRYTKVKGPIGKFASLDEAEKGLAVLLAFEAMTASLIAPAGGAAVTQVAQPFEVAARVTQGKAFAEVSPEFKKWPVVWRQYAALEWPVVGAVSAQSTTAAVQLASVQQTGLAGLAASHDHERLSVWPVVQAPLTVRIETPLVRVALAWPIANVKIQKRASQTRTARASVIGGRKKVRLTRRKRHALKHKTKTIRVAALRLKKKPKVKSPKRRSKKHKQIRAKIRYKANSKGKPKTKVKVKSKRKTKAVVRLKTPLAAKRSTRQDKPIMKVRPHVATRQILHRTLGRGA